MDMAEKQEVRNTFPRGYFLLKAAIMLASQCVDRLHTINSFSQ